MHLDIKIIAIAVCFLFRTVKISGQGCTPELLFLVDDIQEGIGDGAPLQCRLTSPQCDNIVMSLVTWERETYSEFEEAFMLYSYGNYSGFELTNKVNYDGRTIGALSPEFFMGIENTRLEDNGQWKCIMHDEKGRLFDSLDKTLIINADPSKIDIDITPPEHILLGSPSEFKCSCDRIFPDVAVIWIVNGVRNKNGSTTYTPDDAIYSLESLIDVLFTDRDEIEVKCRFENTYGLQWNKEEIARSVPIYAPASVNEVRFSHNDPTPSDTLLMTCIVSGTNHQLTWIFNGKELDNNETFDETRQEVEGDFDFGENMATNSTLTWKVRPPERSCEFMNSYNGAYKCRASAYIGPIAESYEHDVVVMYEPILKEQDDEVIDARVNDTVTMSCEILCASPNEVAYTWTRGNNHDGLEQNTSTIEITLTKDDFDYTFKCIVENSIGKPTKKFVFNEIVDTTIGLTTYGDTTEGIEITESPASDNREALIIANAVIWSLCGVVAIVVVCLALYHYRQIQNGKKYHEDYSEEIILTDDEEKPGTCHDISLSVVGKGAVGGADNDGLYAEIQTPGHTHMPVAPTRASTVQTLQPQPRTPKAKRTHATDAPRSSSPSSSNSHSSDRHLEPKADNSTVSNRKEMSPKTSNASNHGMASKIVQQQKKHETPNKPMTVKQNTNRTKPSVPDKPNISSFRSSRTSSTNPAGAPYDNAGVNLYANCEQRPVPNNGEGTITYADLALQQDYPYDEGAPPVPPKQQMTDPEHVQYASIKHS